MIIVMKNNFERPLSRFDIVKKKKINESENKSKDINQAKTQEEEWKQKIKQNRKSKINEKITNDVT